MISIGSNKIGDQGFVDFGQPLSRLHAILVLDSKYLDIARRAIINKTQVTIRKRKYIALEIRPAELGKFSLLLTRN